MASYEGRGKWMDRVIKDIVLGNLNIQSYDFFPK